MRGRLIAAFAAVYIIWGSTYLAIRFAVETLPPLLMAGARFAISGAILYAWTRIRHRNGPALKPVDWKIAFISGSLLLLGGNGGVVWAEKRVASGVAALLVAVVPLWMVLLDWWRPGGRKPANLVFLGLAIGLGGLLLLVGRESFTGHGSIDPLGAAVLMFASLCWAAGSLYIKHASPAGSGLIGVSAQMMAGGLTLCASSLFFGEFQHLDLANASSTSILGFLYLVTFGSLIGFTAYYYMLAHTTAAKASTYAYVNPVVAVFLGWIFAHEAVTQRTVFAAAIILAGVGIISIAKDKNATHDDGAIAPIPDRAAARQ